MGKTKNEKRPSESVADSKTIRVPLIKPKYSLKEETEYKNIDIIDLHSGYNIKPLEKITMETPIVEIVLNYPELSTHLTDAGLHCIGCPASSYENIGDGCMAHGMSESDVKKLIAKLNSGIKKIKLEREKEKKKRR